MKKYFIANNADLKEELLKIINEAEGKNIRIELEDGLYQLESNIELRDISNVEITSKGGAFIKGSRKIENFRKLNEEE
ncbi:MAG: hypothetical protein J6M16_00800 [Clostridia bacterium]|nr:hypothetical protein [Clostridia bacterium]